MISGSRRTLVAVLIVPVALALLAAPAFAHVT
jgi:hypothetical protein